ncbi:MAG: ASKHA domain-containing protein [Desulfobacterales bacterium]|jgi:uncharacterized 2Fe-2S/4Fe-4S cluster protein (DUF4445 family)
MPEITFLPHNKTISVPDGTSLIRAAMEASVHINASCGGDGVCGKCRVIVESGAVEDGLSDRLSPEDIDGGVRLACKALIREPLVVRVPVESTIDAGVLNRQLAPRRTATIQQMDFDALKEKGLFMPPVEKVYIELPPATHQDNQPDASRLVNHLTMSHDEHRLVVHLSVIRKLPQVLREKDFKVTVTLARPVHDGRKSRIINVQSGDTSARNYAIAMDIGTTTVYGQLIDCISGDVLAEHGEFNGQVSYGEDVITRIMAAEKPGGLEILNRAIVDTVNTILARIIKTAGVDPEDINAITLAGNTTMTQLLLMVDPRFIRRSPYVPASTIYPPVPATQLGFTLSEHVTALVYPQISSYVGGDIVAGVMGSGLYRSEAVTLFMDIGTNAEIVIGNKDWMACAACSAGPAFEGGGIEFGMRAAKGAIEDFSIDPVTLEPMILTIGNIRPKGVCGSGLITMVATMFEMGLINSQGKFDRDAGTDRVRERNGVVEYVLAWKDNTQIGRDIALTEIDIENLIRAKGAIYSGCMTLLEAVGMDIESIEQIYLAGGFGSYVDLEKAMIIGLLPEIDLDRVTYIGNASLMGAKMSSLTNRIRRDVVRVTRMMTNFELSETPSYMNHYVAALFLPHTDLDRFPKLKDRLQQKRQKGGR